MQPYSGLATPPPTPPAVRLRPAGSYAYPWSDRTGHALRSLLSPEIGSLVIEIAARAEPITAILARYELTVPDLRKLMKQPAFRDAVQVTGLEYGRLSNAGQRIKIKAQLLVEQGMAEIWDILSDTSAGAAARVAAFGQLKSLTGLEKPENVAPPQKFKLTINLPSPHTPLPTMGLPSFDQTTAIEGDYDLGTS